jgi:hypothetical protein
MRIQFKLEGGVAHFPGLSKPITIDSEELPEEEADRLDRLVNAAHFFDLPPVTSPPSRGAADYRRYTVTVEDSQRRHAVQLVDPIEDPDLQALLTYLQAKVKTLRKGSSGR